MNQSIDRRIAALEAVSGSTDFILILRRIISPGEVPGEAAFATALGQAGISCNVVAAFYHDHIFVAQADAQRAMAVLEGLAAGV